MMFRKAPNTRIIDTENFGCLNSYVVLHNTRVHSLEMDWGSEEMKFID